jgi:predicted ester cyclase
MKLMNITQQEVNKSIVSKFNKEFIEKGDAGVFADIIAGEFVNQTAPSGVPKGPDGVRYFFNNFLKPAFTDLKVVIHDQLAEGDKVTTRKSFHGTHKGEFMGIPATNKPVVIDVIDIIRLKDGKFVEHWNVADFGSLIQHLNS